MGTNSKALLAQGKALADPCCTAYDKAMLSTSERMAKKLKLALSVRGMSQIAFANACGVSKQAVQGWLKTGRVDKKHLPKFVAVLNYPLAWWLADEEISSYPAAPAPMAAQISEPDTKPFVRDSWPFSSISRSEYSKLSDRQMGMVEGYVRALLTETGSVKRNGTTDH